MQTLEVSRLIAQLAAPDHLPPLRAGATGILQPAAPEPGFIAPQLVLYDESEELGDTLPDVLLVTAPAAVGKTWFAKNLSARSGNPLWDLARFRVGSNFFTGTIAQAYGGPGYAQLEGALHDGNVTLVLDSADEALVRAGLGNYEAAVEDLAALVGNYRRPHTPIVLLGRPETVDLSAVTLSSVGLSWRAWSVDFFDEPSSRGFVREKVIADSGGVLAELDSFLDQFFGTVQEALRAEDWESSKSFLGYAPVLDALATFYIDEPNPHRVFEHIRKTQSTAHIWDLLANVIRSVCTRETQKFADNYAGGDDRRRDLALRTYTEDEQARLLLAEEPASEIVNFPTDTPSLWLDDLIDAAGRQLREHPFLRASGAQESVTNPLLRLTNVAFRDFLSAWTLGAGDEVAVARLLTYLADPGVIASPMLARLLYTKTLTPVRPLPAGALGTVVESSSTDYTTGKVATTLAEGLSDDADLLRPDVVTLNLAEAGAAQGELEFAGFATSPVRLGRAAAYCVVDLPNLPVVLGSGVRDFSAGPQLWLNARSVTVESEEMRVRVDRTDVAGLHLQAQSLTSISLRLSVPRSDALQVKAPALAHPWVRYAVSVDDKESWEVFVLHIAGLELRRILNWFSRRNLTGRLRYPKRGMDRIVARNRIPVSMFNFCLQSGNIKVDGTDYVFVEPAPTSLIRDAQFEDPGLRRFLLSFLVWEDQQGSQ